MFKKKSIFLTKVHESIKISEVSWIRTAWFPDKLSSTNNYEAMGFLSLRGPAPYMFLPRIWLALSTHMCKHFYFQKANKHTGTTRYLVCMKFKAAMLDYNRSSGSWRQSLRFYICLVCWVILTSTMKVHILSCDEQKVQQCPDTELKHFQAEILISHFTDETSE